ncbi:PQQ-binding-like beta-propeller repeat protein [Luteolibacter marinus]|uniref:outer membrane protein assembly factor BamB family protein n=1 Tax=Luteolibacter marinus TaxID=2776705 RepID=UPI00186725CE|nr:PQQ-binding-like beta-propeller repeat protein [Luteolibacter marinus]
MKDRIYLGIHKHVVCIDQRSGEEIWRTELKRSHLVTVVLCDDMVIAHAGGHLFGLRASDGHLLWKNELAGLGYGYCIIASDAATSAETAAALQIQQAQVAAAAAAAAAAASSSS